MFVATIKVLVGESNEDAVFDGINEILREAQYGGPNGENRGWIADWKIESVDSANGLASSPSEMRAKFEQFKLVVEARAASEIDDGPAYAEVTVTPEIIDRLFKLSHLCAEHELESVTTADAVDRWDRQDELRITGDSLQVCGGDFWFEAWIKNQNHGAETVPVSIADLATVATLGADKAGFRRVGDKVFFAEGDDGLNDLIALVETNEGEVCSQC
jgi:hypothetical protein